MRKTTATCTLTSVLIAAVVTLAGCDRVLPTEPEDAFTSEGMSSPAFATDRSPLREAAGVPAMSSEAGSVSSRQPRRRPARPTLPTQGEPTGGSTTEPKIDPSDPRGPNNPSPPPTPTPPPPPSTTNKCGECDGVFHVPQVDAYMAEIHAARDRVRSAVNSGELRANRKVSNWNAYPAVDWQACYFWVENGFYYDENGNKIVGACAAGMTDYAHRKIVVATQDQSRTLALVKWETTNYYLYMIGREDLLDRWQ